jgi:hypothetical protein
MSASMSMKNTAHGWVVGEGIYEAVLSLAIGLGDYGAMGDLGVRISRICAETLTSVWPEKFDVEFDGAPSMVTVSYYPVEEVGAFMAGVVKAIEALEASSWPSALRLNPGMVPEILSKANELRSLLDAEYHAMLAIEPESSPPS